MITATMAEGLERTPVTHEIEERPAWKHDTNWSWCHGLFATKELDAEPKPVTCLWCAARVRPDP